MAYTSIATAKAAYLANADYDDGAGDVAKAKAFRLACRSLLILMPNQASADGASTTMSVSDIRRQAQAADNWLATHDTNVTDPGAGVLYLDMRQFRE